MMFWGAWAFVCGGGGGGDRALWLHPPLPQKGLH